MLADRIGAAPGPRLVSSYSGAGPQRLLAAACQAVADGAVDVALVVGGIADASVRRARRLGVEPPALPTSVWSQGSDRPPGLPGRSWGDLYGILYTVRTDNTAMGGRVTDVTDSPVTGTTTQPAGPEPAPAIPVGLPMPRDPGLLTDLGRRPLVTHFRGRRYPFPIPDGWFVVAESRDLAPGEVKPLYCFGRDLALYRTMDGEPRVVDAHCRHLGAHLAVGGRVEDGCIRCPFHGWKFDGQNGRCVEIPYGEMKAIPPKAHTRSYPTIERNHMIWAWHHAKGGDPFYEVPVVPEFDDDEWTPIVVRGFPVRVSCQDMAENNVDFAHFRFVHGTESIPEDEFVTEGTYKRAVGLGGTFVREGFGLGLGVLRVKDYVTFLSSTTPIDEDHVFVRWVFSAPRKNGPDAVRQAADTFCAGVSQDIPIWENKIYQDPPVITKTEKLILEHRRWARQFYSALED